MAKGTKNGFKTFIILLISLVGAFILGIGAVMLISPGVSIFGLTYANNQGTIIISDIEKNGVVEDLRLSSYDKIVIDAKDAKIFIAYGADNANQSNFSLQKNSAGFYKNGSKFEYSYLLTEEINNNEKILKFVLDEPDYSFLKIVNSTKLYLNMSINDSGSQNKKIEIKTVSGDITLGVGTSASEITEQLVASELNVITEKGNINLSSYFDVSNDLNLKTTSGYIKINRDIKTNNINLSSETGRITTKSFVNQNSSVNFLTDNSTVEIENIEGDVYIDSKSGIYKINTIKGDLSASSYVETTKFNVKSVYGNVYIANENGRIGVDINEVKGNINLSTDNGSIKLGNVCGQTFIATNSAPVDINVSSDNISTILITTATGEVNANFRSVKNTNKIITEKGNINIKCLIDVSFILNAKSDNGTINLVWQDKTIKGEQIDNEIIGLPTQTELLILESISGNISIDRYSD